jgi:hypothetical protein
MKKALQDFYLAWKLQLPLVKFFDCDKNPSVWMHSPIDCAKSSAADFIIQLVRTFLLRTSLLQGLARCEV